jgi:hypothetical protein
MNEITELQGTAGFILSAFFCFYITIKVWKNDSSRNNRWLWLAIFLMASLSAVEIQFSFRFLIRPYLLEILLFFTTYSERNTLQVILITVLSASLIAGVFKLIITKNIPLNIKVALWGNLIILFVFGLAVISLHAIDAIFYAPLFHVYSVCWLWNIGALLVIIGVCIEIKLTRYSPSHQQ